MGVLVTSSASVANWLRGNTRKGNVDNVARYVHWKLCGKANLECGVKWYVYKPEGVCENERYKLLWDMTIQWDQAIEARRPDNVFVDKETREVKIVDNGNSWRHSGEAEIGRKNWEIPVAKGRNQEAME